MDQYARTRLLIGDEGLEKLKRARVAVFGLGGVGGYAVEMLARVGVGALDLVDPDEIALTNLNRQLLATLPSLGRNKAELAEERVHAIDPACTVRTVKCFFLPETEGFDFSEYDYVVDAVDTVAAKIEIAARAQRAGVPVIGCMGTGNKRDPSRLEIAMLSQTRVCPLARVMRREMKKRGLQDMEVVYSREEPISPRGEAEKRESGRECPGSLPFVPAAAGILLAARVTEKLLARDEKNS